jgi:predicted dehydrogenase
MGVIRWGVVGYGAQAKRMASALRQIKGAELVSVCCSCEEKAITAEKELGVRGYGRLNDFLDDQDIAAVYIASPHQLHTPQAFKAAESGRHVLVEKPMSLSPDGAHKLLEIAHKKNLVVGVNFPLRQHPALCELQSGIKSGRLGKLVHAYAHLSRANPQPSGWWRDQLHSGPMCLMDLGVQALDLLLWMLGEKAREVSAIGEFQGQDQPLNLSVSMSMDFHGGAQAALTCSNRGSAEPSLLVVHGTLGSVSVEMDWPDGDGLFKTFSRAAGFKDEKTSESLDLNLASARNFCLAVSEKIRYNPCCEETYPVVETCCAAIESLRVGRSVKVGEILRVSGEQ